MINWQGTVISQYNQAPTIQTLLYAINQWLDPTQNINDFYKLIWNVESAQGYGLDVWGRIVAVNRVLAHVPTDLYWGFSEASTLSAKPFNTFPTHPKPAAQGGGIFYSGEVTGTNIALTDPGFRTLILAKAAFNITDGSIPAINQILMILFGGRGNAYVVDHLNMSMTYVFEFTPTSVETSIIQYSGVLPKPSGVKVRYAYSAPKTSRVFANATIHGLASARAAAATKYAPSVIHGVGNVRATALVRADPKTVIGGRGSVSASASVKLAIGFTGEAAIHGAGHLSASSIIRPVLPGGAQLVSGAGAVRANAVVTHIIPAAARADGVGAARATAMRVVFAASEADAIGAVRAVAGRLLSAAAQINGASGVRATATGNNVGAVIHGVGSVRATGKNLTSAVIHGLGSVRATGTVV